MEIQISGRTIKNSLPALIMGIVNVTDDSFYSESRGGFALAQKLIDEGADIIDLGAESTRPGSTYVSADEEIKRLVPVIREIRKYSSVPISVDTRKYSVMKAMREEGADILNDVSALLDEPLLADFCAKENLGVILMHKRGNPENMQNDTQYSDVFKEVDDFLRKRAEFAIERGINEKNIIVDPGIGFAKDEKACLSLVSKCGSLCDGRFPVLMALSRKSFLARFSRHSSAQGRLVPTVTANLLSVQAGAKIVRVHDVSSAVESLSVLGAICDFGTKIEKN